LVATLDQSPLERFCGVLADHGVEFIVVAGQAEALTSENLASGSRPRRRR
jgi:hypothetical protein